jgi:hypothetical protein
MGLMAIGVGFLAGFGARILGKEGSMELGVIAGTLVVVGVLGAQYFVAWKLWNEYTVFDDKEIATMYTEHVQEAKKVVQAIPNGTDQEIRIYLAREEVVGTGEAPNPTAVTPEEIKMFREEQLPEYQNLASGKVTKDAYVQNIKTKQKEAVDSVEDTKTFKTFFMLVLLSKVGLISLCAAAGLAYKMSTDAPG